MYILILYFQKTISLMRFKITLNKSQLKKIKRMKKNQKLQEHYA